MAAGTGVSHAVYMGNLRSDVPTEDVRQNIIHLLHEISVTVTKEDIDVHKKRNNIFAFVYLTSEQEKDLVLELLNMDKILEGLDLSEIVKNGKELKVAPKYERWRLISPSPVAGQSQQGVLAMQPQYNQKGPISSPDWTSQWSNASPDEHRGESSKDVENLSHQRTISDARKTYTIVTNKPAIAENHYYVKREKTSTPLFDSVFQNRTYYGPDESQTHEQLSNEEERDDASDSDEGIVLPSGKKSKRRKNRRAKRHGAAIPHQNGAVIDLEEVNRSRSMERGGRDSPLKGNASFYHQDVYVYGEILGNENRKLEFKRGRGMYVHRQLADHVAVYTSAFLNSEGGTLLVGVNNNGEVKGVDIDHSLEDRLRIAIDRTVSNISPTVFPSMYRVQFVTVIDANSQWIANRKVIEVSLFPGTSGLLYQTPAGDVYVRRDGSVQGPLKAHHIQEWTRMMLHEEQVQKDSEIINLREKEKQLMTELAERRANEEKLASLLKIESTEKAADSSILPSCVKSHDTSKVCVIL